MILQGTVTKAGNDLYAAAFGKNPVITRAEIGSEYAADIKALAEQTTLPSPIKEAPITEIYAEGNVTHIRVQVNNEGITEPTPLCQIGLYASLDGGAEVLLFAAQVTENVTIPKTNPLYPTITEDVLIELGHGNSVEFNANVNLAAFTTVGMFYNFKNKIQEQINNNIEVSSATNPAAGVRTQYYIIKSVPNYIPATPVPDVPVAGTLQFDGGGTENGYIDTDSSIQNMVLQSI